MKVLGIHIGHDSSAALIKDGKILCDVAEERFNRIKHYSGLPIKSIEYCLRYSNLTINEVDAIAVPSSSPMPELNFLLKGIEPKRKIQKVGFLNMQNAFQKTQLQCRQFT